MFCLARVIFADGLFNRPQWLILVMQTLIPKVRKVGCQAAFGHSARASGSEAASESVRRNYNLLSNMRLGTAAWQRIASGAIALHHIQSL